MLALISSATCQNWRPSRPRTSLSSTAHQRSCGMYRYPPLLLRSKPDSIIIDRSCAGGQDAARRPQVAVAARVVRRSVEPQVSADLHHFPQPGQHSCGTSQPLQLLSMSSLNLNHRSLARLIQTEYCSLYAQDKINFFFKDIERCMPNLRHLDLRCGYPYGSLKYGPVHALPLFLHQAHTTHEFYLWAVPSGQSGDSCAGSAPGSLRRGRSRRCERWYKLSSPNSKTKHALTMSNRQS